MSLMKNEVFPNVTTNNSHATYQHQHLSVNQSIKEQCDILKMMLSVFVMYNIYCQMPSANFLPYGSRTNMTTRWQLSLLRHYCILKVKGTDVNIRDAYNANCIIVSDCIFHCHSYNTIPFGFVCLSCAMICFDTIKDYNCYNLIV